MNYGYENADLSKLIQKYEIIDNQIVITFLDGSNNNIALTKPNEESVLNEMLWQAFVRNNSTALDKAMEKRNENFRWMMMQAGFTLMNAFTICAAKQYGVKIFGMVLGGLTGTITLSWGISYKHFNDVVKELKKYDIYLSMRKQLEENVSHEVFKGIKNPNETLNINTLDNYSLKEIKKIQNNLQNINKTGNEESNKKLLKKISR